MMAVQIALIGLGQIGASVGLALSNHKELVVRTGLDKDPAVARRAKQIGAIDRAESNLFACVEAADLVLLTLPMDQIQETLEFIGPALREGAVVMDTAPVREVVGNWVKEFLPSGRHYVGLTPIINPAYLHSIDAGIEAAHADLFQHGMIAIVSRPDTNPEAIKLAADLTRLLGAAPLFADFAEMDGFMAATHLLPQLLSAALINATADQPGWRDARKVAGRAYAEVSGPIAQAGSPASLASTAIYNGENALRVLDSLIAALQSIHQDIQSRDNEKLQERLERAKTNQETWWEQRQAGDWLSLEVRTNSELPKASDVFGNLLGFRRKPKK
jgi:prephenate dehydrogenase